MGQQSATNPSLKKKGSPSFLKKRSKKLLLL